MGPRSVVHKSAKGLARLLGVDLLLSKRGGGLRAAQETCKNTPMPKSALVMSGFQRIINV